MTLSTSTLTRIAVSALASFTMVVAHPETSFAANVPEAGLWKVNIAKSKFESAASRLVIERVKAAEGAAGAFLVINKGKAYLATAGASSANGVKAVDYGAWKGMTLTQIGNGVRAIDECQSRCRFGEVSNRLTVTFRNVGISGQQMSNALALDSQ